MLRGVNDLVFGLIKTLPLILVISTNTFSFGN